MISKNLKILLGLIAISVFVLLVFYIPGFFEGQIPLICIEDGNCQHEQYLNDVISAIPLIIVIGFVFGVLVSFFYFERKIEVPVPSQDRTAVLLTILQPAERKVVAKIIENGGQALQSELSRIEGVGKVKAHRVIERLIKRGVLEKEQMGKTNILRLRKDLKKAISE